MENTDRPASQAQKNGQAEEREAGQRGSRNFRSGWLYRIVCLPSFALFEADACQPKPTAEVRRNIRKDGATSL